MLTHRSMHRLACLSLALVACSPSDDACELAAEKLATCFPDQAAIAPACDAGIAAEIAASSCDELAARDGKADGWTCLWMPWLCTSGDGGSAGKKIEVAVEECGGGPEALCPYVTSAACGLVTLQDDAGLEISRGFSSGGGRFTFDGVPAGAYTVKVHERDGSLAQMMLGDLSSATGPARVTATVGSSATTWARFNLVSGSAAAITQCARLDGGLTVHDSAGQPVDRHEVEWEWLVELEINGEVVERTRPLFIHHEASSTGEDQNVIGFRLVRPGTHLLRFVRMNIPSYKRRPNPDYEDLRRYNSANVTPLEVPLTVTNAHRGGTVSITRTLIDPLR